MVIADRLNNWNVGAEGQGECPRNPTLSMLSPVTLTVCHIPSLSCLYFFERRISTNVS